MTYNHEELTFSNREFVAMVRAGLSAAGRPDVGVERSWIDEDEPGYPFLLHVPVGTEAGVPLKAMESFFHTRTEGDRKRHAVEFAAALINLRSAETMLVKYARDVRKAANAAVAAARADGLDILLDRVGFKPTYAYHLTDTAWKDAAMHVLANVTFRHTSFYLRPETSNVYVEEPADVGRELAAILEEQRERQDRLAALDAQGCDLIVDGITLDLLAAYGLDPAEILTKVWKAQRVGLDVELDGKTAHLSLNTSGGSVEATIMLPEAIWNGEHVWFRGEERDRDHKGLIGKALGDLVPHPVFTSRPIVDVFDGHHIVFDLSDKHMFDGNTGRIWRQERRLAA